MKKSVILIPGVNPQAAKPIFGAVDEGLKGNFETIELKSADEEELVSLAKKLGSKILIGKSAGARIAIDYQLSYKDCSALVLLAPAIRASDGLRQIKASVLIVHGTEDDVIPIENSRELKEYFENCNLVEIPGADHSYRGKENETAKIIVSWLSSLY